MVYGPSNVAWTTDAIKISYWGYLDTTKPREVYDATAAKQKKEFETRTKL